MHVLLALVMVRAVAADLSAEQILKKADAGKMPGQTISFLATVKEFKGSELLKESRYEVYTKSVETSLVKTVFPERQRGRKMLMEGDSMWVYTPDIRRPTRVSPQQKLTGEVANGDIARTDFAGDYAPTLLADEGKAYHLMLNAKRPGVTYSKIEYWVSKSDFLPIKAVFFSVSGKILKTGYYSAPKKVLGQTCITQLKIVDAVDQGRNSVLIYGAHRRMHVPERFFAKETLDE